MHTQTQGDGDRESVCVREKWGERDEKLSEGEGQRKRER